MHKEYLLNAGCEIFLVGFIVYLASRFNVNMAGGFVGGALVAFGTLLILMAFGLL